MSSEQTRASVFKDPVKTEAGYLLGIIQGETGKEVHIYRGVPYAAPPVRGLRWKPPQPLESWSGIRACSTFPPAAPQTRGIPSLTLTPQSELSEAKQSEDCLYLNILTPVRNTTDRLPVMIWLHGGGFGGGSGNAAFTNESPSGIRLPQIGIVLVNVNMRLGALGLLAHPLLCEESPNGVSGNYMFLDMLASLQWVRKNIAAFGGDPNNVTIFDRDARKITPLIASPLAKGLVHRAICQSGGDTGKTMIGLEAMGRKLFSKLGVNKGKDQLKAARDLGWEKIVEAEKALAAEMKVGDVRNLWDLSVDGWFVPDTLANIFHEGKQNAIPLVAGGSILELTIEKSSAIGSVDLPSTGEMSRRSGIPFNVAMFSGARNVNVKVYAYIFDRLPTGWKQAGVPSRVVDGAVQLGYIFGDWDNKNRSSGDFWHIRGSMIAKYGANPVNPGLTDSDRKLSEAIMCMWAQFARTGDPNIKGLINWPPYEIAIDQYLYVGESLEIKSGFSQIKYQD